jgi:alkanesulfonate monooxygenase SsuD/methylene tetrahydromethanopterin reductase-like flavin-dependent oxidoreductase (luciferase family)
MSPDTSVKPARLELGVFTEFSQAAGTSEAEAFEQAMAEVAATEAYGFDAIWLAEIHFQKDRSLLAAPLAVAAALAGRTRRIKLGIAVQVLPLSHPLHIAEDVATIDHLSGGRVDLGVGRSGLPAHYQGFNIPYAESRDRFLETLEVLEKAWTQERFTHEGKYFQFHDVCLVPKPLQHPRPPIRIAATTQDTYPLVGRMGYPIFLAVRTSSISELTGWIASYHEAWKAAAHPGRGEVGVIVPVYVAETARRARDEPEASAMHFYRSIGQALARSTTTTMRTEAGQRLIHITYDEVLRDFAVYGTPEAVADRLQDLREALGYSTLSVWMNSGGQVPHERVLRSMRLFADRVMPRLG